MKFSFKNIGVVASADIELKGLTVITGLNDTGKSFLSKSIYSVIKTIREAKDSDSYKIDLLELRFRQLNTVLRQFPEPIFEKFIRLRADTLNDISRKIPAEVILSNLNLKKEELTLELKDHSHSSTEIQDIFKTIVQIIKSESNDEKTYSTYFDKIAIQQLFRSQINALGKNNNVAITCYEGGVELLKLDIRDNKTDSFKFNNQFYYQDVTLIDSPIILQLAFFIRQARLRPQIFRRGGDDGLPIYYLDLVSKLPSLNLVTQASEIFSEIEKLIGGKIVYREKLDNFIFQKSNGDEIEAPNTASGIKSFGLIQLLLSSGAINPRSLLIIDEPEVHLHPVWETEYAKMIVSLTKSGIPVLVSSHSPYFLQALTVYIKKEKLSDLTNFYYGEKAYETNETIFIDVTNNLNPIFKKLSDPMRDLFLVS